jgi:hypothetical protein
MMYYFECLERAAERFALAASGWDADNAGEPEKTQSQEEA